MPLENFNMPPERLRELIAGGETLDVEFRGEEAAPFPDRELVEAVVRFANRTSGTYPGWLLVGVEDDGRVSGARPRGKNGSTNLDSLYMLIRRRTFPHVEVVPKIVSLGEKKILCIGIPRIVLPVGTPDGHYLRRTIDENGRPSCVPFYFDGIYTDQTDQFDLGCLDYTALQVEGVGLNALHSIDALDPKEFERCRRMIRENPHQGDQALLELDNLELARELGAVGHVDGYMHVTNLGLLLFGREETLVYEMPSHNAVFEVLSEGIHEVFQGPLLHLMEELETRFRNRSRELLLRQVGGNLVRVPEYSDKAFREGLANAFVHREYRGFASPVRVQWHSDRIEISNRGGFPLGVHPDTRIANCEVRSAGEGGLLGIHPANLLRALPRSRNPLLADAFRRIGIVECTGLGIDTIFVEQLRTGHTPPSYEKSTADDTVLELRSGEINPGFVRFVAERYRDGDPLSQNELLLLSAFRSKRNMTVSDAIREIQPATGETETVRNEAEATLNKLNGSGIVTAAGHQVFELAENYSSLYEV